jgi:hypothetical protein
VRVCVSMCVCNYLWMDQDEWMDGCLYVCVCVSVCVCACVFV